MNAPTQSPNSKPKLLIVALLAVLIISAYAPSLSAWFHGDDFVHVALLTDEREGALFNIWKGSLTGDAPDHNYRPLAYTAFYLFNTGDSAFFLRIFVLIVHIGTALMFFAILRRSIGNQYAAFGGALVFALHPALQPTVLWVSALGDVMTTSFSVLAILCYLVMRQGNLRVLAILFCYAGAALSKETGFVLPGLLLLLAWRGKTLARDWRLWASLFITGVVILAIRSHLLENIAAGPRTGHYFTPGAHTLLSLAKYVYALAIPFPWHWTYAHSWLVIAGLLIPLGVVVLLQREGWKNGGSVLIVSAGMIALPLLPVMNVFANWYLYMPAVGFGYAAAHVFCALNRYAGAVMMAVVVAWFGVLCNYNARTYVQAGEMEKQILAEIAQLPENEIMVIGMPRQYRGVPMITFSHHLELALDRYYDVEKRIDLPVPTAISHFDTPIRWETPSSKTMSLALPANSLDYFDLFKERGMPWKHYITVLTANRWGFPVEVELTRPNDRPMYIFEHEKGRVRFVRVEGRF